MRSAIAPETMVAVVAQKTRLKTKFEKSKFGYAVKMSKPGLPIKPIRSSPSRSEKPIRMNITVPMQKSIKFFIRMLPVFFARVKPVSTIAKPACIQKTSAAPIKNHTPKISLSTDAMMLERSISMRLLILLWGNTNSHLKHVIRTASFPPWLCFVPLARTSSTPRFTQLCQNEKYAMLDAMF